MSRARRLAAIMFTDIVGYTKLMQQSEDSALQVRKRHREVFEPITLKYDGEILQYYGDGTLSIFASTVSAVKCACELQKQFLTKPKIPVRIGIHSGDIIVSDTEVIGDSVNLAARVESLGVAGSVLISAKVAEEIKNQEDLSVIHLGRFHLKNDEKPRDIFAMNLPELIVPDKKDITGKLEKAARRKWLGLGVREWIFSSLLVAGVIVLSWMLSLFDKPGIDGLAVLPFSNLMNDPGQEHLVFGVHEALISKLQQVGVNVKAHRSMMQYSEGIKSIREIAREQNVDGVVEGTVLRAGNSIEVEIRLINGKTEEYMWSQSYERDLSDIMTLYGDMTRAIAGEIQLVLTPQVQAGLINVSRVDPESYELYLKGRYHSNIGTPEDVKKAIQYYNQSLEIDTGFGPAYSGLVESYLLQGFGEIDPQDALTKFRIYARKAIELDERITKDHHQMAMIKIFSEWDWKGGELELKKAIKQDPSWSTYDSYSQLLWAMGRMEESVAAGERAVELDPKAHFAHCDLAWAYYYAGRTDKAAEYLDRVIDQFGPDCPYHSLLKIRIMVKQAESNRESLLTAIRELEQLAEMEYGWTLTLLGYAYARNGQSDEARRIVQLIEDRGDPDFVDPVRVIPVYIALGEIERAFNLLERAYSVRSFILMYTIKSDPWFDPLRNDPRFEDLLRRMGLTEQQLK